jgi:hypothetical protein
MRRRGLYFICFSYSQISFFCHSQKAKRMEGTDYRHFQETSSYCTRLCLREYLFITNIHVSSLQLSVYKLSLPSLQHIQEDKITFFHRKRKKKKYRSICRHLFQSQLTYYKSVTRESWNSEHKRQQTVNIDSLLQK